MISRSSIEVEYWATANTTSEMVWIRNLLLPFGHIVLVAHIYYDNHIALHIANNPVFY